MLQGFLLVPTKGIEPSRPCERQILSLLRLPIPPHGQFVVFELGCNITSIIQSLQNTFQIFFLIVVCF
jgi:hypothetical protein